MTAIKCIAFDLDDTLLDTSQLLVPLAARHACEAMLNNGVSSDVDTCLAWRASHAAQLTHQQIFQGFIDKYGTQTPDTALQAAMKAFYNPEVPARLPLMDGAVENLRKLGEKYILFLVTSGEPDAQMKKIKALQIEPYFRKVYLVNNFKNEIKKDAFADILKQEGIQPEELLSIGNRLSQEIRYAKVCGAKTCYFCHGEHVGETPEQREDYPDFTIYKHAELIKTCGL
ncbi:HAD family hydrolase [Bdellovibrio sp. HCB337]|uniref:HAD family hydrolase n=1 Tax=Bdellovibrio sp. HCB337 TaxID=3394358 RepID=UPI0039A5E94D